MSGTLSRAEVFERLKIAVRERPLSEEERSAVQVMLRTDNDKLIAFYPDSKEGLVYNYDIFFPEESTQDDLFQSIGKEMTDLVVSGYSANCISFGPSASGKTHTLFGSDHEPGLIQSATKYLFRRLEETADQYHHSVRFQYWEMNCDTIKDAINVGNPKPLNVRRGENGVEVMNLTSVEVNSWAEFDDALMQGNIKRIQMSEERSARWHGFVKLIVESVDAASRATKVTRSMTFAQLKGPDRVGQKGARGDVLRHGSNINKSISLLCSAILHAIEFRRKSLGSVNSEEDHRKLIEKSQSFFMESKFTHVMSQCLCGTEASFMVGTVCTLDYHETTDTLENLQNAQQLTASLVRREVLTSEGKLMKKLEYAVSKLPQQNLADGHPLTEIEEKVQELQARLGAALGHTDGPSRQSTGPSKAQVAPQNVPEGIQVWKQSVIKSKLHGDRAKIYIPTGNKERPNTYQGQWAKGRREGLGAHVTSNTKYEGEYKSGLRDGEGTLWIRKSVDAPWERVYKGGWRAGKRHGRGINYSANGDVYDGFFEDGERSAIGKLFLPNGDRVEGQFRNNQIEGYATLYCANGDWFEGHWRAGMREGPGVWYYESRKQCYRGEWSKNIPKFGVIEDYPTKETNESSRFVPRVGLVDYEEVLRQQKEILDDQRSRETGGKWEAPQQTGDEGYDEYEVQEDEEEQGGNETVTW